MVAHVKRTKINIAVEEFCYYISNVATFYNISILIDNNKIKILVWSLIRATVLVNFSVRPLLIYILPLILSFSRVVDADLVHDV